MTVFGAYTSRDYAVASGTRRVTVRGALRV